MKDRVLNHRYHLLKLLNKSNFSQTFLAKDLQNSSKQCLCVIKQLTISQGKQNRQLLEKIELLFEQEAEILKTLSRKNRQIPQFYDYFVEKEQSYLVQEWIEGTTLQQQGKIPAIEAKRILINFLPVLEYIHSCGIIHRDLKPSNIILRKSDRLPVLIDFGVAQKITASAEDSKQLYVSRVGTPGYMPLEQAMGKAVFSSDLYSLGLTAIQLLTGKEPLDLKFDLYTEEIFWDRQANNCDRNLAMVINRAISDDPSQRFCSAGEMLTALQKKLPTINPVSLSQSNVKSTEVIVSTPPYPQTTRESALIKPERLLPLVLIFAVNIGIVIWGINYFLAKSTNQSPKLANSLPFENEDASLHPLVSSTVAESKFERAQENVINLPIFIPGTTEKQIVEVLGEPIWRRQGYWDNSIAWSYKNVISEGIDLGYLFDTQTKKLRQTEIALPASTQLETLQKALLDCLGGKIPATVNQGLQQVYWRQKNEHSFTVGNLEGLIQRNQQDRIYIGVWEADFH